MFRTKVGKILLIGAVTVGFVSCNDSATDSELPEPPALPDLQQVPPESGFFSNNQGGEAFNAASQLMLVELGFFSLIEGVYLPFFSQADQNDPDFSGDVWEWTYSYSFGQDQTSQLRLTAEESGEEVSWALYLTGDLPDRPEQDNFLFMEGTTLSDGSEGSWTIHDPSADSPGITFGWNRTDDENYTSSFTVEDSESSDTFTISYTKAGADHTLEITASQSTYHVLLAWNTDTNDGHIVQNGTSMCWGSDFETLETCTV